VCVTVTNNPTPIQVSFVANSTDAFGRMRVSISNTIFDSKMLSSISDGIQFNNVQVSGAGTSSTWSAFRASITLAVSSNTAGRRIRQTYRHFNYIPGREETILMTVVPGTTVPGIVKRWGYNDDNNRFFFEMSGASRLFAVTRTTASGVLVERRADITGAMPVGWSSSTVVDYVIHFTWLGAGAIEFGVYTAGVYVLVYTDPGNLPTVTISMPNQPLRFEILNNGSAAGTSSLECISASISTDGAIDTYGAPYGMDRGASTLTLSTDGLVHSLLAVRLNPTGFLHATAALSALSIVVPSGAITYRALVVGSPTVAGPALVWTALPNSPFQYAVPVVTNTVTGGTTLGSLYGMGTSSAPGTSLRTHAAAFLGSTVAGVPTELHLCVERFDSGGGTDTFIGAMDFITSF